MANVIEISGLVKDFGRVRALAGLDLEVQPGEVHGFLGPNGSGKTTTIRVLLGLIRRTAGSVNLFGGDPWKDSVALHRRLAYVPGDVSLWPNLTGGEAIDIIGRAQGGLDLQRRDELTARFDLDPSKKGRSYSKGSRQKVAIVAGLSVQADLLILDEPTSGLDPLMEATFQEVIRELKRDGKTVLLSSHILAQVEALADRVTIIREGRTVETGSLDELRHLTRTDVVVSTAERADALGALPGVHDVVRENGKFKFSVDGEHLDATVRYLAGLGVQSLISHPPTLEQIFLRHYESGAKGEVADGEEASR